jgi:signal transduction histidine kinase
VSAFRLSNWPRIFDAFFTTRSTIGTGIALFVAKQFIEGHGGKVHVETSTDPASHGTKDVQIPAACSRPYG